MTSSISWRKTSKYFIYLPFFFFLFMVYRTFGEIFVIIASSVFAILLGGLLLARMLHASVPAVIVYLLLLFNVINFIVGFAVVEFYVLPLALLFLPLIFLHYTNVLGRKIPGSTAFFIMAIGLLLSIIYQTATHVGDYPYGLYGDSQFLRAFAVFFSIYMLLALRILSLWKVIVVLSFSVLPEIIFILILYATNNLLGHIFLERLGSSLNLPANQIAIWLDMAFPLALFIALYDKRPKIKKTFSVLATIYGAILLMTASRGSLVGLPIVPFFIAAKTKSILVKIIVVVVFLTGFGLFGRGMIERTLFPNRADYISNLGRKELIIAGKNVLKANHYFFGIGMDNYKSEKYNFDFMKSFDTKSAMSTHNVYLEMWIGWGLIGLLGWLAFIGQGIVRVARARLHPDMSYLKPAILLAISLTLIHALFDSPVATLPYLIFFFSIMACAFFLGESQEMRQPSTHFGVPSDTIKLSPSSEP
jgi:O-antigen ligase